MKQISLLAIMLLTGLFYAAAQEKESTQKTIIVTGIAETEVVPDEIYVQVDLKEYDKKGVGKIDIESIKSNFLNACKSIGLADTDISVQQYDGSNNYWLMRRSRKKDPDLKAGITYWVKLSSTSKMDELVDKLDDEATQNFTIAKTEYSKRDELKKQLKITAIRAARDKAVYLTEAINEHIGDAVTITDSEERNNAYQFVSIENAYYKNKSFKADSAANAMDVGFTKIKFQFQVNVVFALK